MIDVIKALYNCSFTIWNTLMQIAMTLFTTSPKSAGGGTPYSTVHTMFNAISDATVPIATVFFIIAIYKSVISAPPEQQAQRFLMDALRVIDDEEITLYMINPKAPCFIRDKEESYIYLILPVNFTTVS